MHGTLKIGALQLANVKAANIHLEVRGEGGKLDVAPLSANLYQGALGRQRFTQCQRQCGGASSRR